MTNLTSLVVAGSLSSPSMRPGVYYNLLPTSFAAFRGALNGSSRNAIIATCGNSTDVGVDETANPYDSQGLNSCACQLARILQASGVNAGSNNIFGSRGSPTLTDLANRESRFTFTGSTAFGSNPIWGGASFTFSSSGSIIWTPVDQVTKFVIYWANSSVTPRTFSWKVDGGGTTNLSTTGVAGMNKTVVSAGALGAHALTLAWVAGSPNILGIDAYDDTAGRTEVSVWNWGQAGAVSASMIGNTGSPSFGHLAQLSFMPPDILLCEGGLVNDWRTSVPVGTTYAHLTTLAPACVAAGTSLVLYTPPFDNGVAGLTSLQDSYANMMYQIAGEQNIPLFDWRVTTGSYAASVAAGFQVITDAVHPTAIGYGDRARFFKGGLGL